MSTAAIVAVVKVVAAAEAAAAGFMRADRPPAMPGQPPAPASQPGRGGGRPVAASLPALSIPPASTHRWTAIKINPVSGRQLGASQEVIRASGITLAAGQRRSVICMRVRAEGCGALPPLEQGTPMPSCKNGKLRFSRCKPGLAVAE